MRKSDYPIATTATDMGGNCTVTVWPSQVMPPSSAGVIALGWLAGRRRRDADAGGGATPDNVAIALPAGGPIVAGA